MFVDDDNVISYNENERKRNNEVKSKLIDYNERGIENIDYINVKWRRDNMSNKESSIENKRERKEES